MTDYWNSKWAMEILDLQNEDGSWGYFHSLSKPGKNPITTEQALRRLYILGYDIKDDSVKKCVSYMTDCLLGKKQIPDRREKLHDWDIFSELMLSTWIRRFTIEVDAANKVADTWSEIISGAFVSEKYIHEDYISGYHKVFGMNPRGGRLVDFVAFYQISLISKSLEPALESFIVDYILNHESGIYYIYNRPLSILPENFASKEASGYLAAIELLTNYGNSKNKLRFVIDWLNANKDTNGKWGYGKQSK